MRKRLVATIAAGAAAVLMLSGFDSAMTVQELTEKSKNAIAQASSLKADIQGEAAATLNVSQEGENGASMTIPINGLFNLNTQLNLDPLQIMLEMEYRGEAMGQGMDGRMEMYILEKEDGTADAYMGTYSSSQNASMQWMANTADAEQVGQLKTAVDAMLSGDPSALSSLSGAGLPVDSTAVGDLVANYQDQILGMTALSQQSVMVDGKECYQLTADVSGNDLLPLMTGMMSASGQTLDDMTMQMMEAVLSGIRIRMESDIDTATKRLHFGREHDGQLHDGRRRRECVCRCQRAEHEGILRLQFPGPDHGSGGGEVRGGPRGICCQSVRCDRRPSDRRNG